MDAITTILSQVLDEFGARLDIDGGSHVLVSSSALARSVYTLTEPVRNPFGPKITVTSQTPVDASTVHDIPNCTTQHVDALPMDYYTHAVFGVDAEDPKYVLAGLRHMKYALRPKGYAVVISLRRETREGGDGEEGFQVSLEDKMKYQSKGKIDKLSDVMEYADFERGRIRSLERTAQVEGKEVQAEVILAMKWDQLTA